MAESKQVALAGLLHDIGKFQQRALWGERKRHEVYGAEWVKTHLLPRLRFLTDQQRNEIAQAIERHHEENPYERDIRVVQLADRLVSGERIPREGEERGDPSTELLLPVFTALHLDHRFLPHEERQRWRLATVPLQLDGSIFPQPKERVHADYPRLWRQFEQAWQALPDEAPTFNEFDAFVMTWLSLLRIYAWCVPSAAYQSEPDVSLADHLQMTGAMAFCLWHLGDEALERLVRDPFADEEVALLIGGDIGGIQRFLYTISSKGAAKSLRGRSAYLSLLSEAVAESLRRHLCLPPCNIIYSSGGHFYMLAPLTAQSAFEGWRNRLAELLLGFFGGELAIVAASVPMKGTDFRIAADQPASPLGQRWRELSAKLSEQKRALWREQAIENPQRIFGPFGLGGDVETCDVCHSEPDQPEGLQHYGITRPVTQEQKGDEEVLRCSLCQSFEELADKVWQAQFLLLRPHSREPRGKLGWHTILQALGLELWLDSERELADHYRSGDWVFRLNCPDLSPVSVDGQRIPVIGFRFMPQHTPMVGKGDQRRIADLTELSECSKGAPYFGALRMDVDNLGRLFAEGLGGTASLSRLATLSRSLSVFFEGYLNAICQEVDGNRQHLYLLYSGGDDLLVVGSWDAVIALAERVRAKFREYVCGNPCVTVSAGTTVHHDKFPLYQAARIAGAFLEAAKEWRAEKNAFGFWGKVVDWDDEQKWLREWHDQLVEWLESRKATRALVFKLTRIAELYEQLKRQMERTQRWTQQDIERRLRHEKWCWRLVYTLARERDELRPALQQLQKDLVQRNFIRHLLLLTRWVELSTR